MLFVEFLGLLSLRAGRHVRGSLLGCLGKRFSGSIGRQSEEKDHNRRGGKELLRVGYENTRNRNPLSAYSANADEAASPDWTVAPTSLDATFLMN